MTVVTGPAFSIFARKVKIEGLFRKVEEQRYVNPPPPGERKNLAERAQRLRNGACALMEKMLTIYAPMIYTVNPPSPRNVSARIKKHYARKIIVA